MAVVFISHSSQDNEKVEEIKIRIKNYGFDSIFLARDKIKIGENWEKSLYDNIKRSHTMLIVLSSAWMDSKWCFSEYTLARALGKEIIPIIIDQSIGIKVDDWIDRYLQKSDMTKDDTALNRVINRIKEVSLNVQGGFTWDKHRAPYPGMMSFEEEDAAIFFGREDETREVVEKLNAMNNRNTPKFLNIVASSGMGKSSFLKAGIIPQLKRSYSDRWIVLPTLRPSKRPLYTFAKLIASILNKELEYKNIYMSLQDKSYKETLDDIITEIEFLSPHSAILLVLDQAEELYALAEKEEKKLFFRVLGYLVEEKEHFFTIWTLRSDYLKELQLDKTLKSLQKMMEIYSLSPLKKENVVSIIQSPAIVAGITIDTNLIEKIKEDMQTTDALPLLALALSVLYKIDAENTSYITLKAYKSLAPKEENPLEHIVKQEADKAISTYIEDEDSLKVLKEAFIPRIVGLSSESEPIQKVAVWNELPRQSHNILEALVKARLLIKKTVDNVVTVEIAHAALIHKWPLLQTWLIDEHEFLVGKVQLEAALQDYTKEKKQKDKALLTGIRLQKASDWLEKYPTQLKNDEKTFIKQSLGFERKQSRRKKIFYISTFILVLLFGIFSAWQWKKINEEFNKSEYNMGIALINQANNPNLNTVYKNLYAYSGLLKIKDKNIKSGLARFEDKARKVAAKNIIVNNPYVQVVNSINTKVIQFCMVSFNQDSKIASASLDIVIRDKYSGKIIKTLHDDSNDSLANTIDAIAITKNDNIIVSGSRNGIIRIWNIKESKLIRKFHGHSQRISSIAVTKDGQKIISASSAGSIKVWDIKSGKLEKTLVGHTNLISSISVLRNRKNIVSSSWDGTIKVWDLETGNNIKVLKGNSAIMDIVITSNEKNIISTSLDGMIQLWDLKTEKFLKNLVQTKSITCIKLSKNEKKIIVGLTNGNIEIWDRYNKKLIATLYGHSLDIVDMLILDKDKTLISSSNDATIKVWDLTSIQNISKYKKHKHIVSDIALLDKDKQVVSVSKDNIINVWDLISKKTIKKYGYKNNGLVLLPEDRKKIIFATNKGKIIIQDLQSSRIIRVLNGHSTNITSMIFTSDKKTIISASKDGMINLWNVKSGELLKTLNNDSGEVHKIISAMNNKILITNSCDEKLKIWDLEKGTPIKILNAEHIRNMAISKNGKKLISASHYGEVILWDLDNYKKIKTIILKNLNITSIAITLDEKKLITGSNTGKVTIWNLDNPNKNSTLTIHKGKVNNILILNNKSFITNSSDGTIKLSNLKDGALVNVVKKSRGRIRSIWTTLNEEILISFSTGKLVLYDFKTSSYNIQELGNILSIAVSIDGAMIISGNNKGIINLWVTQKNSIIKTFKDKGRITDITITEDKKRIISVIDNKIIHIWDINSSKMIDNVDLKIVNLRSMKVSPDGKTAAFLAWDNKIKFLDLKTKKETKSIPFFEKNGNLLNLLNDKIVSVSGITGMDLIDYNNMSIYGRKIKNKISSCNRTKDNMIIFSTIHDNEITILNNNIKNFKNLKIVELQAQVKLYGNSYIHSNIPYEKLEWSIYHPQYWLKKAQEGDNKAMYQLGVIYDRDGENEKALSWYKNSLRSGYAPAKERVEFLTKWMKNNIN